MSKTIFCQKLEKELEALSEPPFPGALGARLKNTISKDAWNMWLAHQTMLINEYRLNLIDPKSREFLRSELEKYFFGEGSEKPTGFSPEN